MFRWYIHAVVAILIYVIIAVSAKLDVKIAGVAINRIQENKNSSKNRNYFFVAFFF